MLSRAISRQCGMLSLLAGRKTPEKKCLLFKKRAPYYSLQFMWFVRDRARKFIEKCVEAKILVEAASMLLQLVGVNPRACLLRPNHFVR